MDGGDLGDHGGGELTDYAHSGAEINERLRQQVVGLCSALGLQARRQGHNLWIKDTRTGSGNFTSVAIRTDVGYWKDFRRSKGDPQGGGDLIHLIAEFRYNGDDREAIKWALAWLGLDNPSVAPKRWEVADLAKRKREEDEAQKREAERNRKMARRIWLDAKQLTGHDPASLYLLHRGIDVLKLSGGIPHALRFADDCLALPENIRLPAMLASVSNHEGMISCHRTYLDFSGGVWRKAWKGVERDGRPVPAKRSLGSYAGGSIRLTRGITGKALAHAAEGEWVGIAEGIENALTVGAAVPELRTLAAVSVSNIGNVELPAQVIKTGGVYVIADNDIKQAAIDGLENAIERLRDRGLMTKVIRAERGYKDLNDLQNKVEHV